MRYFRHFGLQPRALSIAQAHSIPRNSDGVNRKKANFFFSLQINIRAGQNELIT